MRDPQGGPGRVVGPSGRFRTNWGTLGEVRDGSGVSQGRPGQFGCILRRSGTGWGTFRRSGRSRVHNRKYGKGWGTHEEVWDGSVDTRGGPGRVGGILGRSGTGRETHVEVQDGSGDPRGGPERVKRPSGRSEMGRGNLGDVRYGSADPRGCSGGVGDSRGGPGRVGGQIRRSGSDRGTHGNV